MHNKKYEIVADEIKQYVRMLAEIDTFFVRSQAVGVVLVDFETGLVDTNELLVCAADRKRVPHPKALIFVHEFLGFSP